MRDLLETTCRVEARLELAPLDARDLCAHQCGAGFEIFRAILRPYFELSVMGGQSLEVLPSLVGYRGIAARRMGKRTIEVILRRFKKGCCYPKQPLHPQ